MEELEWRDIPGYPGYQVTVCGRIRSLDKWSYKNNVQLIKGRELGSSLDKEGYPVLYPYVDGVKKRLSVHRAIAMTFIPNPKNKKVVNHINGVKNDNRVENLEWCTQHENNIHAYTVLRKTRKERQMLHSNELYIYRISEGKWTVKLPFHPFNSRLFGSFKTQQEAVAFKEELYKVIDFTKIDENYRYAIKQTA